MWPNKADYIQILIIALVFGSAIVQFLYRTFFKSMPRGPARGGDAGGEPPARPAKSFREFLQEIREEARRAQGEAPPESAPAPEATPPEPVQPREPAWRQSAPSPTSRRREHAPRRETGRTEPAAVEDRFPPAEPPGSEPESVHQYLEELARGAEGLTHLETRFGEAPAAPPPLPSAEALTVPEAAAAVQPVRRGTRSLPLPALGLGLRDAMLAQVILGPPRSRAPRRGPRG